MKTSSEREALLSHRWSLSRGCLDVKSSGSSERHMVCVVRKWNVGIRLAFSVSPFIQLRGVKGMCTQISISEQVFIPQQNFLKMPSQMVACGCV